MSALVFVFVLPSVKSVIVSLPAFFAGESAIQSNVTWGIANYTDATARQYLIDTYHWTINGGVFDGNKTIKGGHDADTLHTTATKTTLHGLGTQMRSSAISYQ
jgi:hypothetical protein